MAFTDTYEEYTRKAWQIHICFFDFLRFIVNLIQMFTNITENDKFTKFSKQSNKE